MASDRTRAMRSTHFVLIAAALAGCSRSAPPAPPPQLFESRSPYVVLEKRLRETGGDPSRALVPRSVADLLQLAPGRPYKYAVRADGTLAIAPAPADDPASDTFTHPILALGQPVRTAGALRVDHDGKELSHASVDQSSRSYCPSAGSLISAVEALRKLGVPGDRVRAEDKPVQCDGMMGK
jgi:hypothetical protein